MQNKGYPPDHQWTILDIINWTASFFSSHHIDSPRTSAEIFLAHVLGVKRIDLYLRYDQPLTTDERARFKTLVKRRINREPVAYITGKKVGLYTSPHLVKFNERICINNKPVADNVIVDAYHALKNARYGSRQATFFEFSTAMAFWAFGQQKVDWAIIETGMGGKAGRHQCACFKALYYLQYLS